MLQWISQGLTARRIDGEVESLVNDTIIPGGVVEYLRYNVDLGEEPIRELKLDVEGERLENLTAMDAPENLDLLYELGVLGATRQVKQTHFRTRRSFLKTGARELINFAAGGSL